MKKLFLIVLCALFVVSCSNKKTVVISGKVTGGSPLERIEIIDASSAATLPIANFGVDAQGNFSDTIEIPKNGVYAIIYGGAENYVYLKSGQNLVLNGQAGAFPRELTVGGDNKNNIFLQKTQTTINTYFTKVGQDVITKDEPQFLAQLQKFRTDLDKEIDNLGKSTGADSDVIKWKKDELDVNLLMISSQYALMHGQVTGNPAFKVSQKYTDYQKELTGNEDDKIKTYPVFRQYMISTIGEGFQTYAQKNQKPGALTTEMFINYLKDKKYSQTVKDYLISFVATKVDMHPQADDSAKLVKLLDENIKDGQVKADMKKVEEAIFGLTVGTAAPSADLVDLTGKTVATSSFNGKPTLMVFYASWVPYISESMVPVMKEVSNTYKSKMNIVFVNMDDNLAQFKKTAPAMLNGIDGTKVYAKGGLNSDFAKKYAIYGFKLPSYVIIDKDGKIASKTFLNVMEPDFKTSLDKASGLTGPAIVPPQPQQAMMPEGQAMPVDTVKANTVEKAK